MNEILQLYLKNDMILLFYGLVDNNGAAVAGASVTAEIVDDDNSVLASITMTDIPDMPGDYTGRVDAEFSADEGYYDVKITALKDGLAYHAGKKVKVTARKIA